MLEVGTTLLVVALLVWFVWLRVGPRLSARLEWFRATLARVTDWRVSPEQGEVILGYARRIALGLTVLAVGPTALWVWRYPEARSQAIVARYQRMLVYQRGAESLWGKAQQQLQDVALGLRAREDLSPAQKVDYMEGVEPIYVVIKARRGRSAAMSTRIEAAISTVPRRVWPWSVVEDPLTQVQAPVTADENTISELVLRRIVADPTSSEWFDFAASAGRPGAPALPDPSEWEGL